MEKRSVATGAARAKINLFLDVVGRREDGYHLIDGVMQSLALSDRVDVRLTEQAGEISLTVKDGGDIPADGRNLAWRAAEAFLSESGLAAGVRIGLRKSIPAAGGLAGGSSDAACVLRLLNRLAGEHSLSQEKLHRLAERLGADVPFCLESPDGAMRTEGIGTVLTPVPALPDCTVMIANAGEGVPTPWAYARLDALSPVPDIGGRAGAERMLAALRSGDLMQVAAACRNVFEAAVIPVRPRVSELKARMLESGALTAMMSGSGPSVFGLFEDRAAAAALCVALQNCGVAAFVTAPAQTEIG